jgi:hypothetical protein
MNGTGALDDGYRRLLALYPAEHRRAHEEEMLGVLMSGARAGQHRPGLAESADLIWGALRIRLRPGRDSSAAPRWRDALAVVSVVLPLLLLVYMAVLDGASLAPVTQNKALFAAFLRFDSESLAAWLILTALVLLRLRRTAALVAAGMLAWYAVTIPPVALNWSYIDPHAMLIFIALGLETAVLVASPGPQRGLQILRWKHYALAVAVPATVASVIAWLWLINQALSDAIAITVIAVSVAGMMAASPLSRRIAAVLSVPAYYCIVGLLVMPSMIGNAFGEVSGWEGPLRITLTFLPLAAIIFVAIVVVLRSSQHTVPAGGLSA